MQQIVWILLLFPTGSNERKSCAPRIGREVMGGFILQYSFSLLESQCLVPVMHLCQQATRFLGLSVMSLDGSCMLQCLVCCVGRQLSAPPSHHWRFRVAGIMYTVFLRINLGSYIHITFLPLKKSLPCKSCAKYYTVSEIYYSEVGNARLYSFITSFSHRCYLFSKDCKLSCCWDWMHQFLCATVELSFLNFLVLRFSMQASSSNTIRLLGARKWKRCRASPDPYLLGLLTWLQTHWVC